MQHNEEKIKEILGIYNAEILNNFQDEYLMTKGPGCEEILYPVLEKSFNSVMSKHEGEQMIHKAEILDLFKDYASYMYQKAIEDCIQKVDDRYDYGIEDIITNLKALQSK